MKPPKGSFLCIPLILYYLDISVQARELYGWLLRLADVEGRCFYTLDHLENLLGISRRSIVNQRNELQKRFALLENKPLLTVERDRKLMFTRILDLNVYNLAIQDIRTKLPYKISDKELEMYELRLKYLNGAGSCTVLKTDCKNWTGEQTVKRQDLALSENTRKNGVTPTEGSNIQFINTSLMSKDYDKLRQISSVETVEELKLVTSLVQQGMPVDGFSVFSSLKNSNSSGAIPDPSRNLHISTPFNIALFDKLFRESPFFTMSKSASEIVEEFRQAARGEHRFNLCIAELMECYEGPFLLQITHLGEEPTFPQAQKNLQNIINARNSPLKKTWLHGNIDRYITKGYDRFEVINEF